MVEGLMLTMTGEELRGLLRSRSAEYRGEAKRWQRALTRTPGEQTTEDSLFPEQVCENEAERCEWRADVLEFLHEHLDPSEVYRLGQSDLEFGELLPEKPEWMEQDEYEKRRQVGQFDRFTKRINVPGGSEILLVQREPEGD